MTINTAKIFIDYRDAKKLLEKLEIDYIEEKEKAKSLRKTDFTKEFIKQSYKDDYRNMYRIARENLDYNLLIKENGSIFQFGYELDENERISDLRYAYYEAPSYQISYEQYLSDLDLDYEECGNIFFEDYTQVLSETALKNNVTSIRYDFNISQRKEIIHPVSHLHIGQQNEIRIPVSFIMTPKNFVAFIVRHIFWNKWRIGMENPSFKEEYLSGYSTGPSLDELLFTRDEKRDLYFKYNY
ncbi:DUF2290 domain-containing protein [Rummeliibacillus stabekisii]|uniref:DUF2290 domain-containing protein n=1 Tax=Rummeliibacillus stabekisii TaxID=241244 RepID=UPI00203AB98A|nr:DUF2290 domain-containing protein [Rummeliibacillus stabekisii]MCM3318057.1 DUF2290 domain-containing protein [Rummeliibacillus stabekisii]